MVHELHLRIRERVSRNRSHSILVLPFHTSPFVQAPGKGAFEALFHDVLRVVAERFLGLAHVEAHVFGQGDSLPLEGAWLENRLSTSYS